MTTPFRADNLRSMLRQLIERAPHIRRDGSMPRLREVEDRYILTALELQKSAGIDVFTDGEYRRGYFMADFTKCLDGMLPAEAIMAPVWRGPNSERQAALDAPIMKWWLAQILYLETVRNFIFTGWSILKSVFILVRI
jgi:5-methyltetrahydropteroyltriglutamate--homocysteine methyltransferase